jgi:predicted nucleic-acid-binding Zn-ribbon protein
MADYEPPLPPCPSCGRKLKSPEERLRNLCDPCSKDTGVWVQVPDLRPPVPCARCNHTRFVRSQLRERGSTSGQYGEEYMAPLAVSFATKEAGFFTVRQRALPKEPIGIIVAYVCQQCGFTELYTRAPAQIPIGPQYGTDLIEIDPKQDGPFR